MTSEAHSRPTLGYDMGGFIKLMVIYSAGSPVLQALCKFKSVTSLEMCVETDGITHVPH